MLDDDLSTWHPGLDYPESVHDEERRLREENVRLREALRRCGELALNRKTGAIQHLVKKTLDIEHFSPDSGEASGEAAESTDDEPPREDGGYDPRPDPRTHPEFWTE